MRDDSTPPFVQLKKTWHGRPSVIEKRCEWCGAVIPKPAGQNWGNFIRRKSCSDECKMMLIASKQRLSAPPKSCAGCGEPLQRRDDEKLGNFKKRKTCSDKCRFEVMANSRIRSNKLGVGANRIIGVNIALRDPRICTQCGDAFSPRPNEAVSDFNKRKTCSEECRRLRIGQMRSRSYETTEPAKICSICGSWFAMKPSEPRTSFRARKTCGELACVRELQRMSRLSRERSGIAPKLCPVCGVEFTCRLDEQPNQFTRRATCSRECMYVKARMTTWGRTERVSIYPVQWNDTLKASIKNRDGNRCVRCEADSDLHVHHIDYNKSNCHPRNLITLCNSCHGRMGSGDKLAWKALCRGYLKDRGVM